MNVTRMRAYCGDNIFDADVRATEEGVEELRQTVLESLFIDVPETGEPKRQTLLVAIPGGKA